MSRAALAIAVAASLIACQTRQIARPDEEPKPEPKEAKAAPGRPPVPASPEGLLAPGGARKVSAALSDRGFLAKPSGGDSLDAAESAALRKFQEQEGLAATGFPDRETLRRLGLSPEEIYRDARPGDGQ